MKISTINNKNRLEVNNFIIKQWYSSNMVVKNKVIDMRKLDGFIVLDEDKIIGLITYSIEDRTCEIISLDSLRENRGIGTKLLNRVIEEAKVQNCMKVKLITTNDNIKALKFYQRRDFDMVGFYYNALEKARVLKPSIPLIGENDIPLRHEIEFELKIEN